VKRALFFLILVANTLCIGAEDRGDASSPRKRVSSVLQKSYWDIEAEEKQEKRRKKFRLGAASVRKSGQKAQRAATSSVRTTEGNRSLTSTPAPYKRPPEDSLLQIQPAKKAKLAEQTRRPEFLSQVG
jgi:hypothetical protein